LGLLLIYPLAINALEFELNAGVDFLAFHPDRVTAHIVSENHGEFQTYPFGMGNFSIRNDITDSLGFSINVARDKILRNSLDGRLITRTDYFSVEFGPFVGIGDQVEIPDAGIIGKIGFSYPGIAFFSLSGSSTLGSRLDFTSVNYREYIDFQLGFWLPFVIPILSGSTKNFVWQSEEIRTISDTETRAMLSADIHIKNVPVTVRLDGGYEILTRSYKTGAIEIIDELSAFFAGFEINWQVTSPLKIKIGAEMPVYLIPVEPMTVPDFWTMPKAKVGVLYKVFD
jgi:hypothetical protein